MSISKFSRKLGNQMREHQAQVMSFVLERFSSITTVRLNNREDTEKDSYSKKTDTSFRLSRRSHFGQGLFMSFIGLSTNVSLMAVLNVGGGLIATGELTAGSLIQFAMQVQTRIPFVDFIFSESSPALHFLLLTSCFSLFLATSFYSLSLNPSYLIPSHLSPPHRILSDSSLPHFFPILIVFSSVLTPSLLLCAWVSRVCPPSTRTCARP